MLAPRIAASEYSEPAIRRMSCFKTNQYANLIGGKVFEPKEGDAMLGFRDASRNEVIGTVRGSLRNAGHRFDLSESP
jgi:phosphoenolpyruvate synthase/pyruvate phosphate dikinase